MSWLNRLGRRKSDKKPSDDQEPDLADHDRAHAGTGPTPPEARVIHEIIREDGEKELRRSVGSLSWSGFSAGLSMGFSFLTMAFLRAGLPDAPWRSLISSFGYTVGFLIVVLGRQQLFTESTLTALLPFLIRRDAATFGKMLRLWLVVFLANLVGTALFAVLVSQHGLFEPQVNEALKGLAAEAMHDAFWPMLVKAILAGWLIALMVWLIPGAGPARLLLILIVTYVVAIAHFSHIIAGSVEAAYNVVTGAAAPGAYFTRFLVPTLIGNMIGGISLVGILNYAPIREELPS